MTPEAWSAAQSARSDLAVGSSFLLSPDRPDFGGTSRSRLASFRDAFPLVQDVNLTLVLAFDPSPSSWNKLITMVETRSGAATGSGTQASPGRRPMFCRIDSAPGDLG